MFDLGFQELIVIFIVALLVFGPKKLPELARTLGKGIRDIRQAMSGVKEQFDSEIRDVKDPISFKNEIYKDSDFLKDGAKITKKEEPEKTDAHTKAEAEQNAAKQSAENQSQKTG
jgi:sec-independent protein translocase protein TatB